LDDVIRYGELFFYRFGEILICELPAWSAGGYDAVAPAPACRSLVAVIEKVSSNGAQVIYLYSDVFVVILLL
jgi:hypothetical protein